MKLLNTIIVMAVVLFVITFSLDNTEVVNLGYYGFVDLTVPAYLVLFITFAAGVIFAGFFGIVERWRLSRKADRLSAYIRRLEEKAAQRNESSVGGESMPDDRQE